MNIVKQVNVIGEMILELRCIIGLWLIVRGKKIKYNNF